MHTEISITTTDSNGRDLYDILTAFHVGHFEAIGPGFKITTSESGPRQWRNAAQALEYLANAIERRRIETGHCPADALMLDANGFCPNTNCIHSTERHKVKR